MGNNKGIIPKMPDRCFHLQGRRFFYFTFLRQPFRKIVSSPQFLSSPLSSIVMMIGLLASCFRVLPPLALFFVFFLCSSCGSLADLSGPPRRVLRGFAPRGSIKHISSWPGHRAALIAATGGPLLGSMRDLLSWGVAQGNTCLGLPLHLQSPSSWGRHCRGHGVPWRDLGGGLENLLGSLFGSHPLCWRSCDLDSRHSLQRFSTSSIWRIALAAART